MTILLVVGIRIMAVGDGENGDVGWLRECLCVHMHACALDGGGGEQNQEVGEMMEE